MRVRDGRRVEMVTQLFRNHLRSPSGVIISIVAAFFVARALRCDGVVWCVFLVRSKLPRSATDYLAFLG